MLKIFFISLGCLLHLEGYANVNKLIRVACVGNSITEGFKLQNPTTESYPAQLQRMLGSKYMVKNFGKAGTTLLSRGHKPYIKEMEYFSALSFTPDIVVIHLGINDTDPRNWPMYGEDFVKDYLHLIEVFRESNPKIEILIARISPIKASHLRFKLGTRQWHQEIQRTIEFIAMKANVKLVDFHTPLYHYPMLLPDAIHPNKKGASILAREVYAAITGNYGGLQMSRIYSHAMMLPQGKAFAIRGIANAKEQVHLQIGNQKHTTVANPNGRWEIRLLPLKAGNKYKLKISTRTRYLNYDDVLAGDIWLCTGQSSKEWTLKHSELKLEDSVMMADSSIRFFNMHGRWSTQATQWSTNIYDSLNNLQYFGTPKWTYVDTMNFTEYSSIAYHFARRIQSQQYNLPIGIISNAVEGSPIEAWIERSILERELPDMLLNWYESDYINEWVRGHADSKINETTRHPFEPTYLFEAGIHTLDKFPIKGILWYQQSEPKTNNFELYEKLFTLMLNSWREYFEQDELPLYYIQHNSAGTTTSPRFRDQLRRMIAKTPQAYMNIEPNIVPLSQENNAKIFSHQIAQAILHNQYGHQKLIPFGPLYRRVKFEEGAAYLSFAYDKGLRSTDGAPLRGFEIAEQKGKYVPAKAQIIGQQIKLQNETIKNPRYVRYEWTSKIGEGNLENAAGLPAFTFSNEKYKKN
ncbi:MAG: GDSL-type esterase/lipase family protein [Bacteroidales bacterium]